MSRMTFFTAGALLTLLAGAACGRLNYEEIRTPISSAANDRTLVFNIDSQPQGANTYVDSVSVGQTPVTVQAALDCKDVTYKTEKKGVVRRWGLDVGAGAGLLAGSFLFTGGAAAPDVPTEGRITFGIIAGGLFSVGLALFVRGLVLKSKHNKVVSSSEQTVTECPPKNWKLLLAKDGYVPAERILKPADAGNTSLVILAASSVMGTGAAPPAMVDKAALLSSMAATTDTLTGSDQKVSKSAQKVVEERMGNLQSYVAVGPGFEVAGEDFFLSMEAADTKMFEMTTEPDYCYIISAVAQPGNPLYLAVFRDGQEIKKNFTGSDIASVEFCSTSSDPVRVTTYSVNPTTAGFRIYYQAK
jgi:hypothetical protein